MRATRLHAVVAALVLSPALIATGCGDKKSPVRPADQTTGTPAQSLVTAANLEKALASIRPKLHGGKLSALKVQPSAVTATVIDGGKVRFLTVSASGLVQSAAAPAGATATFGITKVDPAVPEQMIAELGKRFGKRLQDIDYVLLAADPVSKVPFWNIFVTGGVDGPYQADLDGSHLATAAQRAKTQAANTIAAPPVNPVPSPPGVPTGTSGPQGVPKLPANIAKIQRCIQQAATDTAKAAACIRGIKVP